MVELARGYAKVELTVRPEFANSPGWYAGGLVMSLADHAFGCALNTLGRLYVAVQFTIPSPGGASVGETLTAEGRVLHAGRTTGLGETEVRGEGGRLVVSLSGPR